MISQLNSSALRTAYSNNSGEAKEAKQSSNAAVKQSDESRVDQLKESIGSGTYKVNIDALAQKMAQDLL